jgi:hypothetical protein
LSTGLLSTGLTSFAQVYGQEGPGLIGRAFLDVDGQGNLEVEADSSVGLGSLTLGSWTKVRLLIEQTSTSKFSLKAQVGQSSVISTSFSITPPATKLGLQLGANYSQAPSSRATMFYDSVRVRKCK